MSKAVLISIKPKWCEKIASGEKTIEVRKTKPKIEPPFKCYIYETSGGREYRDPWMTVIIPPNGKMYNGAQTIIGEFVCDKIIKVNCDSVDLFDDETKQYIGKECCLNAAEYHKYTLFKSFGWHISDLKIYDEPKELSEFGLKRPPQSWCYVEEENA